MKTLLIEVVATLLTAVGLLGLHKFIVMSIVEYKKNQRRKNLEDHIRFNKLVYELHLVQKDLKAGKYTPNY